MGLEGLRSEESRKAVGPLRQSTGAGLSRVRKLPFSVGFHHRQDKASYLGATRLSESRFLFRDYNFLNPVVDDHIDGAYTIHPVVFPPDWRDRLFGVSVRDCPKRSRSGYSDESHRDQKCRVNGLGKPRGHIPSHLRR